MYPKWAGGTFFLITGSKSKTLRASFRVIDRVAQITRRPRQWIWQSRRNRNFLRGGRHAAVGE